MATEELLDEITPDDGRQLVDPRVANWLDIERSRAEVEHWKRIEHIGRLREEPLEEARARSRSAEYHRAAALAQFPGGDGVVGEIEPDPAEVDQQQHANAALRRRAEAQGRDRRVSLIMYDLKIDRAHALVWWAWENGQGTKPEPVVADDGDYDDPLLDEIRFDANGNGSVIDRQRPSVAHQRHQPTQSAGAATREPTRFSQAAPQPPSSARCSVCRSGKATQTSQALAKGASIRRVATQFGFSEASLRRHGKHQR